MKKISFLFFLSLIVFKFQAQNSAEDKLGTWYMYNGSHKISDKFALKTMAHFRYYEMASEFQQGIYRLGANYSFNPTFNFTLGVSYAETDTQYKVDSELLTEYRIYEDFNLNTPIKNIKLNHRFRLEHRFIDNNNVNSTATWLRYDFRVNYPLSEKWSTYAFNEIFLNFKGDTFAQNWTGAGFLFKMNDNLKLNMGYFHQKFPNNGFNRILLGVVINTDFNEN